MLIFNKCNTSVNKYNDLLGHAIGQATNRNMLSLHCIEIKPHQTNNLSRDNIDLIERYGLNAFMYLAEDKIDYNNNIIIPTLSDSFKTELLTTSQSIHEYLEY